MTFDLSSRPLLTHALPRDHREQARYQDIRVLSHERVLQGRVQTFALREGIELGVFDLHTQSPYSGRFPASPQLVVVVVTEGKAQGGVQHVAQKSPSPLLSYQARDVIVACSLKPGESTLILDAGQRLSGIELRLNLAMLEQLSPRFLTEAPKAHAPLQMMGKTGGWVTKLPRTPTLWSAARSIRTATEDTRRSLSLEGLSLCLLDEVFEVFEVRQEHKAWRQMGQYEAAIREAAELLTASLAEPWTIQALAQRVGLPEKRLKYGFRKYYNIGPYGFLQKTRMEHAKKLLLCEHKSIINISMQVGYNNSSHFSKIFKREFGVSPSMMIR